MKILVDLSVCCPACGEETSEVKDSRPGPFGIRRRRHCTACGQRYTTHETVTGPEGTTQLEWSAQHFAALYQSIPSEVNRRAIAQILRMAAEIDPDAKFEDEAAR